MPERRDPAAGLERAAADAGGMIEKKMRNVQLVCARKYRKRAERSIRPNGAEYFSKKITKENP